MRWLAGALIGLYVVLALSASFCLFGQSDHAGESHHHAQKITHSVLCAWACQATSTVLVAQIDFSGAPVLLVLGLAGSRALYQPSRNLDHCAARAPPSV